MQRKSYAVTPFIFGVYPIVYLWSKNIEETIYTEVLVCLGISILLTAILLACSSLLFCSLQKATIVTTIFLVKFYSFGRIFTPHGKVLGYLKGMPFLGVLAENYFLLVCIALGIFFLFSFLIFRVRQDISRPLRIINRVALILLLMPVASIVFSLWQKKLLHCVMPFSALDMQKACVSRLGYLPNIYYIIFDEYGREDVLKDLYDFDNSSFVNFLENNGFFVAKASFSNYSMTLLSLASSLNMDYLKIKENGKPEHDLYQMIQNNKVAAFLKSLGYHFIHFSSGQNVTHRNPYADIEISNIFFSKFALNILKTTLLGGFDFVTNLGYTKHADTIIYNFKMLKKVSNRYRPQFVFCHMMVPHPPFIFDSEGNRKDVDKVIFDRASYIGQVQFSNKKIRGLIKIILAKEESPPRRGDS